MANNVTEKIAALDAIIKRAGAIKKRSLEIIHEETMLMEDLDRYDELLAPDDSLRAEVEEKARYEKRVICFSWQEDDTGLCNRSLYDEADCRACHVRSTETQ